jgi:hypothetical protein
MTPVPNARSIKTETPLATASNRHAKPFIAIPVPVFDFREADVATG